MTELPARELTLRQAADLTGLSLSAIQRRVERGSLPTTKRGGRRYVKLVDLYGLGMIRLEAGATVADLLDRLERQAERIGKLTQALSAADVPIPDR